MIEFSITDEPDQRFSTILNGRRVTIRIWYAVFNDRWSFDVSIDDEPVLHGRKMVSGVDLLKAFNFDIGVMFVYSEKSAEAGRDEFVNGVVGFFHSTEEELNASISS